MNKKFPHHKKWGATIFVTLLLLFFNPVFFAQAQSAGSWIMPLKHGTYWTSGTYHQNYLFVGAGETWHTGMDLAAVKGTPVHAAHAGTVVVSEKGWMTYHGYDIFIHDPLTGEYSFYAHLSASNVSVGQKVKQGEQIGLSGCMAGEVACHLHWSRSTVEPSWFWTYELHAQDHDGKGWAEPMTYVDGSGGNYTDPNGDSQTITTGPNVLLEMPVSDRALSFIPESTVKTPPQEVSQTETILNDEDEYLTIVIDPSVLQGLHVSKTTVIILMGFAALAIVAILIIYSNTGRY